MGKMTEKVYKPNSAQEPSLISIAQKPRYWELDFLRGICVIIMVIDHFFYSAYFILPNYVWKWSDVKFWQGLQEFAKLYWFNNYRNIMHYVGVGLFCLICGISCTLSSGNAKRGIKAFAVAALITMVTYLARIVQLELLILFGVIHMLAVSMLLYSLFNLIGKGAEWSINRSVTMLSKRSLKKQEELLLLGENRQSIDLAQNVNLSQNINSAQDVSQSQDANLSQNIEQTQDVNAQAKIKLDELKKRAELQQKAGQAIAKWVKWLLPAAIGIIGLIIFFATPLGHFAKKTAYISMSGESIKSDYIYLFSDVVVEGSTGLKNFASIFVNLSNHSISSSDYFPLIPYALMVLIGSAIGRLVYHTRAKTCLKRLNGGWNKPVNFVGKHALLVYLFHQLVIVAFLFAMGGLYSAIS